MGDGREKRRIWERAYYKKNRDKMIAKQKAFEERCRQNGTLKTRQKNANMKRPTWQSVRFEAMTVLGSKCARCGITDERVLQFDHIRGDGNIRRQNTGINHNQNDVRRRLRDGSLVNVYQLLCANCHIIKTRENKEYMGRWGRPNAAKAILPLFDMKGA